MKNTIISLMLCCLPLSAVCAQDDWGPVIPHRRCGTSMNLEQEEAARAKSQHKVISTAEKYVPHTGTVTVPVILVNYKDTKLTVNNPQAAFEQFFNGATQENLGNGNHYNYGSVSKYFSDMSSGEFNLKFKVYAPVTVDSLEAYYGGKDANSSKGEKHEQLVKDAIEKLAASGQVSDDDVTSFCNGGSTIDCVYIIYAGCGQNYGGAATAVWANTTKAKTTTFGGKTVRWFSMAGELTPYKVDNDGNVNSDGTIPMISGIGVTCHELSHALGLPDIYPTASNARIDNQEMEYWDLMDGGEYSYRGFCPTAFTAFEKNEMGWPVTIEELTESKAVTMETSTERGGTAYKIANPDNSLEYFLLECIQKRGWNKNQYGNGLLVYHVFCPSATTTLNTQFNNTPGYPGMAVVPADGACLSSYIDANSNTYVSSMRGDLFPGTGNVSDQNVTELSDTNPQPNFCWYNKAKTQKFSTNKALQNITFDTETGYVSFNYIHDVASAIDGIKADKVTNGRIYTLDGRYVGTDMSSMPKGVYIVDGKKVVK